MFEGYKIHRNDLISGDLEDKANDSSIKLLAAEKSPDQSFVCLLRGNCSYGYAMQKEGLKAVPSPEMPSPGNNKSEDYFAAKDSPITANVYSDRIDVIQNEFHSDTRLNRAARIAYAEKLARAIISFYKMHYGRCHTLY